MRYVWTLALATVGAAGACTPGSDTSTAKATVVDSAVPRDVALANFRRCCASTDSLTGGAPSRDSLVVRFVRAIESKDTAALRSMLLSRAEFAWLYYDTNPQSRPPYDLSPSLMWFLTEGNSSKGIGRALDEYGDKPLRYVGYACDTVASHEGANTVWGPCTVKVRGGRNDTISLRLFGPLIERAGRWKFVSYGNKL